MRKLASDMKPGSRLLMGVDMIKDEAVLHAAYNDKKGVTAEFNLNILEVVNEILRCKINKEDFEHLAFFNKVESRVEMHLVAKKNLIVISPYLEEPICIKKGERIHTENSHKFSQKHIEEFTEGTGLKVCKVYSDEQGWFSLVEFEKE